MRRALTMPDALEFESMVAIVDRLVRLAARRGDGAGMLDLRRRLQALLDPAKPPASAGEQDQASIDFEQGVWVEAISELLQAKEREAVVAALQDYRDDGRGHMLAEGTWTALDPDAISARDQAVAAEMLVAQHSAVGACRLYERTRRTSHLREAVRELESARRSEREQLASGLSVGACDEEADRLGWALGQVLSPPAFRFFARVVREHISAETAERRAPRRRFPARGAEEQWLSRDEWTLGSHDEEGVEGIWFIDLVQARFDEEIERNRLVEEAEEHHKREAEAKLREWQSRRDEEARLKNEEELVEREAVGTSRELDARSENSSDPGQANSGPAVPPPPLADLNEASVVRNREDGETRAPRGSVTEMDPAMAAAVAAELRRRAGWDAELARREADRMEYEWQLRTR
jgi:hypothetical protein